MAHGPLISKQNYLPALHPNGLLCSEIAPQGDAGHSSPWPPSQALVNCRFFILWFLSRGRTSQPQLSSVGTPGATWLVLSLVSYLPGNLPPFISFPMRKWKVHRDTRCVHTHGYVICLRDFRLSVPEMASTDGAEGLVWVQASVTNSLLPGEDLRV